MKKAALVTGGAKRIGREIALKLASKGYCLALTYNSSLKEAEKTARAIAKLDVKCELFRVDLARERDLFGLIPAVLEKLPYLNLLINNASVFEYGSIRETSPELFDKHIATNIKAPYFLSRDFSNNVKEGQIINILDTRITSDRSTYAAYSISKKMLAEFTRMAAREFAPKIRVNAIAPGLILPPEGKSEKYLDELAENIPMRRKGSTESITGAAAFLEENNYITGQIIFCDGGEHLTR